MVGYNLFREHRVQTYVTQLADPVGFEPRGATVAGADMAELWVTHRSSLVRLAVMLVDDYGQAEDIVQEAYIRACSKPRQLREPAAALAYLRQTVVNLSRSSLRRRMVANRHSQNTTPSALVDEALNVVERDAMVHAVRALPRRNREAVTLRYYLDLTEAQTAQVMGVSVGSVKSYTSRGLDLLARELEGTR